MDNFSKDFESHQPLFCALGKIVYLWSNIETSLDFYIAIIFYFFYRKDIIDGTQEIPRSLNMKIRFLKKAFRNIHHLNSLKDKTLAIIEQISSLSKKRHDVIHGVLIGINPDSYKFAKFDYAKELSNLNVRNLTFTIDDLHQLKNEMMGLLAELHLLDSLFLQILPKP